jgi:hypothetical protein
MSNVIEVTPQKILGYILLAFGVVLWIIVITMGILLVTGTIQPISIPSLGYGADVIVGISFQLGIYAILVAVGMGLAKTGADLIKS